MNLENNINNFKIKGSQPSNAGEAALWELLEKRQLAHTLGNDSGETSDINKMLTEFEKKNSKDLSDDEIAKIKKATEIASGIVYSKEAGMDATSGGH